MLYLIGVQNLKLCLSMITMENQFSYPSSHTVVKNILASKATIFSLAFFITALILNLVIDDLIAALFPHRPIVPDLFFVLTPHLPGTEYLPDLILLLAIFSFILLVLPKHLDKIPYYFTTLGLGYLSRALFLSLTPMGNPAGEAPFGLLPVILHGMFPSGHIMLILLLFLLTEGEIRGVKLWIGILVLLEIITLILSRGHYSIDIIGGLMVAYIVKDICEKHQQKLVLNQIL